MFYPTDLLGHLLAVTRGSLPSSRAHLIEASTHTVSMDRRDIQREGVSEPRHVDSSPSRSTESLSSGGPSFHTPRVDTGSTALSFKTARTGPALASRSSSWRHTNRHIFPGRMFDLSFFQSHPLRLRCLNRLSPRCKRIHLLLAKLKEFTEFLLGDPMSQDLWTRSERK